VAFVVADPSGAVDGAELAEFARARLSPPEVPKRIEFVEELPRTPSGKLLRRRLV
jgi:acyl-coenzyme A synthetase/AMP-(fatty) acid ligase